MSIFSAIKNAIFGKSGNAPKPAAAQPAPGQAPAMPQMGEPAAAAQAQPVDVEQVLTGIAHQKGDPNLNWRTSIVDLLKLLDLDSSLAARKELAGELNIHAGPDGSAEENIALHKAVMRELEKNGGKVPAGLKD